MTPPDPWRGVKVGDRFYDAGWNEQTGGEYWHEVTDLYFDPVRGQDSVKRGYMVAIQLMGRGTKRAVAVGALIGRRYVRMEIAQARAACDVAPWMVPL
jgi:hypothetical protein